MSIEPEADACSYEYLDDVHSILPKLVPLREMLLSGDLRPLYLAWLACACDEDSTEPPIPAGLGQTDRALEALAEFYEIFSESIGWWRSVPEKATIRSPIVWMTWPRRWAKIPARRKLARLPKNCGSGNHGRIC